jgi:hypothetical protein
MKIKNNLSKKNDVKIKHKVHKELFTFESEGVVANRFYVYMHDIEVQLGEIKLGVTFKINEFEKGKADLAQQLLEVAKLVLLINL